MMTLLIKLYDSWLDLLLRVHPIVQSSNLVKFAEEELRRAELDQAEGDYRGALYHAVLRQVRLHAIEGHSGGSHEVVLQLTNQLLNFKPLTPLTGEEDEWLDLSDYAGKPWFQNVRCPTVFRDATGVYNQEGRVFREPDGTCFTSQHSRVPVTFPYIPKTEIVDVSEGSL